MEPLSSQLPLKKSCYLQTKLVFISQIITLCGFLLFNGFVNAASLDLQVLTNDVSEGAGTAILGLELTPEQQEIPLQSCTIAGTITYASSDSTATQGADFVITNSNFVVSFDPVLFRNTGPASTREEITIQIIDDNFVDGSETDGGVVETAVFAVSVSQDNCGFQNLNSGSDTLYIVDNDVEASIDLFINEDATIFSEDAGSISLGVDLYLDGGIQPQQSCSINGEIVVQTNSEATEGQDFTIANKSFSIPYSPDQQQIKVQRRAEKTTSQSIAVSIIDDDFVDGTGGEGGVLEEVILGITNVTNDCGIEINNSAEAIFYISDNDEEVIVIEPEPVEPTQALLSEKAGLNKLQVSIAEALDNSCVAISNRVQGDAGSLIINSNEASLLNICDQLQASTKLASDLEQLSPTKFSAMRELALRGGMQQSQNLSKQLAKTRQGDRGVDVSGLSLNIYGQRIAGNYVNEILGGGAGDENIQSDWSAFVGGSVQIGEYEEQAFDLQGNNIYAGLNYQLNESVIVGAALGYNQSDANFDQKGNEVGFKSYNFALLGSYYVNDNFYLDSVFTYGINEHTTDRRIVIGTNLQQNTANTDGSEMTLAVNSGYTLNISNYFFTFFAALNYVDADIDQFDEEVKGAATLLGSLLTIDDQSFKSFTTNLGLEMGWTFSTRTGVVVPKLSVDWEQQHEDKPNLISTRFLADPTNTAWTVKTQVLDDNYYNAALSLNAIFKNGFSTYIVYDAELGREDISLYEISLGARWEF